MSAATNLSAHPAPIKQTRQSNGLSVARIEVLLFPVASVMRLLDRTPSRPGELHPEPLTDPDVNLSIHPARATQRRLPPSIKTRSSSGCPLTPARLGGLLPSLHGHYAASSLLLSSATLVGASVLSASWGFHLHLFPFA